jgi:tetratricopeptide (TPR) repeat protein
MSYVVDPASSYAEQTKQPTQPDFLQFPRQTIEYKAGDCDDLSILYAAFLEAVGIESAFVTVPGHIFIAFSLGMTPDEARRVFTTPGDLIAMDKEAWVPVEVTEIRGGFLAAWKLGAREWREASARSEAGFLPVHDAWTVYEAVGLPDAGPAVALPPSDGVRAAFLREMEAFVDQELQTQVDRLETAPLRDARAGNNRLGVLYARYGRFDQAVQVLSKSLEQGEYLPALVNLGNIKYLTEDWAGARAYYQRAAVIDPANALVHLGIARAAYEMEDYQTVDREYGSLLKLDPDLAARYRYLQSRASGAGRAAAAAGMKENVPWEETE